MAVTEMKDDDLNLEVEGGDGDLEQEFDEHDSDELDGAGDDLGDEIHGEQEEHGEHEGGGEQKPKEDEFNQEEYGQKVQKRINKLTARAKGAEERAQAAEQELADLRASQVSASLKTEHEEVKRQLQDAYDEGDSEAIVEAQDKLADVRSRMNHQASAPRRAEQERDAGDGAGGGGSGPSPATQSWLENNEWFSDPKYRRYNAAARDIEKELRNEGYELDEDLYTELDRRLEEEMPNVGNLRKKGVAGGEGGERERGKETVAPQGGRTVPDGDKPKSGRLNKDDLRAMSKYGFDPNSPADRRTWLNRNKL